MSYCCYRQYDNYFSLALLVLRFFSRVSHFLLLFSCFRCFLHVCLSKSDIETYITTSNDILKIGESLSALFLQKSQCKNSRRKDFQFCQRTLSGLLAQFKKWYFFGDKMDFLGRIWYWWFLRTFSCGSFLCLESWSLFLSNIAGLRCARVWRFCGNHGNVIWSHLKWTVYNTIQDDINI